MKLIEVKAEILNQEAFPAFGEVIDKEKISPEISNDVCSYTPGVSDIQLTNDIAQISLLELKKPRPFICESFERHMNCSEATMPLGGQSIAIFGLPDKIDDIDSGIDLNSIRAFILDGTKAINVRKRIWHCLPFPVSENALYAIIFEKNTHVNDIGMLDLEKRYDLKIKINI